MMLAAGVRIGPYEVLAPLGAGGMGEVYRAKDARLNREVAIKVLPPSFANDPDRLRRFEQEARATSALNHPNILTVHDIGTHDNAPYIVSELLDGEELRAQLNEGPLPERQALDYAQQITQGLSAAHEKGITHRDLKPENLFVTHAGRIKILDFGLAKLNPQKVAGSADSQSPTRMPQTDPGTIMGTAGYMSPEQVRGQDVDHRSDLFSFGAILYEMLTGKRAFHGESMAEAMTAIVKEEPPEITETNSKVPPQLERIVRRCLEKKPERRFQSTSDLSFALEALFTPSGSRLDAAVALPVMTESAGQARLLGNVRLAWFAAAFFPLVALAALPFAIAYFRRVPSEGQAVRLAFVPPDFGETANTGIQVFVSPDGRLLLYIYQGQDGKRVLMVRPLDSDEAHTLPGTERATNPFWSPDSRSVAFFAEGKLKRIEISGGHPQVLCDAPDNRGGAWGSSGVIVFHPGGEVGLYQVAATGGAPTPATTPDSSRGETTHRFPHFLPDGRHFLYLARTRQDATPIFVASLDSKEVTQVIPDSSRVVYAPPGYLLFVRERTLFAQAFDPEALALKGEPIAIAKDVYQGATGLALISASNNGVLTYLSANIPERQLTWFDRDGKQLGALGPKETHQLTPRLSPDGKRVAFQHYDSPTSTADIWLTDVARDVPVRLTSNPGFDENAVWSPDGSRVAFGATVNGVHGFYQKAVSGGGEELLLKIDSAWPDDWSRDGRFIIYETRGETTRFDLWALPLTGDRTPRPVIQSEYNESGGRLSPDGRWMAYVSDESGSEEVYVQPFDGTGVKVRVSTSGGTAPRWRGDGKELFYAARDRRVMVVEARATAGAFEAGAPKALFDSHTPAVGPLAITEYEVMPDGQRFLVYAVVSGAPVTPATVVLNWTAGVKK